MTFLSHHVGFEVLIAWFIFSAVVSGMPDISDTDSKGYKWAYKSLHILAADFSQFFRPSSKSNSKES